MSLKIIFYAYILGGFTLVPLLLCALVAYTIYTSEPVSEDSKAKSIVTEEDVGKDVPDVQDMPKTRKGWLTVRRTFEESTFDGGYVTLVRSFLDARSKDPKRSRPKGMWYVVLKGQILYLYEDETMTDCEAAIQLGSHDVVIYPEGLLDGELFTKRNSICLKPKSDEKVMPSLTREMKLNASDDGERTKEGEKEKARKVVESAALAIAREQALDHQSPWFIFVRSTVEMEDWYFALVHASQHPAQTPTLDALQTVFSPSDMNLLVSTLDEQPDIIPMRWFNAIFGRIFYSFYKTEHLETFIIGRLMKKLSKVKRPNFLNDILVTDVSVGNRTPVFSKPMLKELTREGDASMEVHVAFKGEVRITLQAAATINLGARFKPYVVKLVLAAVLRELEGNLLIKVKRPPSNRIWYAFTQMPKMVLNVEPIVSDRQITWNMILSTIESSLKTIIQESIVMPNMDDIAFFDTSRRGGMSRGGIWADAAQKHSGFVIPSENQPTASDAGPPQEPFLSNDESASTDSLPPSVHKSSSLQETSSSAAEPSLLAPSYTMPEDASSNRRKTWFSSVRNTHTDAEYSDNNTESESRGRTLDVDTRKATAVRSQSTPNAESILENDEEGATTSSSLAAPLVKQRSASQSSSGTVNELSNELSTSSASDNTRIGQNNDGSSLAVPAPTTDTPPSPNSFLTTLKSRAADKQALSNTAKETMRKWGMKWGGINKPSPGSSSHEDMPDHDTVGESSGLTHSRSRTMSALGGASSNSQKTRASYAEVRAAVAERKGRVEHSQELSPSRSLTPSSTSTPITIPLNKNLSSQNSEFPDNGLVSSSGSSVSSSSVRDSSSYRNKPILDSNGGASDMHNQIMSVSSSASNSSSTTSTKSSTTSVDEAKLSSRSHVNPDISIDEVAPAHAPIYVQPQAKTMSIPGIHASHRGEVMSMGYVPPSLQEDKTKDKQRGRTTSQGSSTLSNLSSLGASSMGSLSKNPKLQSMYRLWKQAASNNSNSENHGVHDGLAEDAAAASSTSLSPETDLASTSNGTLSQPEPSVIQVAPVLPASSLSKRVPPPPLPPRPSPVTISPSRPPPLPARTPSSAGLASLTNSSSIPQQSPNPSSQSLMPPQPTMSSASDVLKGIATKDDHTRKRASLTLSSTPPSPTIGRRVSLTGARSHSPPRAPPLTLDDHASAMSDANKADTSDVLANSNSQLEVDATRAWGLNDEDSFSEGAAEPNVH
ncbi:hypothetical protein F5876DRAFT_71800 [Lentinula aff. lateritia]|uniref:Uncharacterized protein n=1 Tax=Lentinula aff. lateritia TaxID=2804960 RepID=A0ACC1UFT9_9AGAR|nr:hypothetical protein F5876DRAFT_71800 [Lentinula aff. lateritia]